MFKVVECMQYRCCCMLCTYTDYCEAFISEIYFKGGKLLALLDLLKWPYDIQFVLVVQTRKSKSSLETWFSGTAKSNTFLLIYVQRLIFVIRIG